MANTLYPLGKSLLLTGGVDWTTDDIYVALLDDSYTYDDAHEFVSDLGAAVLVDAQITSPAIPFPGVADAADISFGVDPGLTIASVVIYKSVTDETDSPLLVFMDENSDTTPILRVTDGSDVDIIWSSTATRIFQL